MIDRNMTMNSEYFMTHGGFKMIDRNMTMNSEYFMTHGDPRTRGWPMLGSAWQPVLAGLAYLCLVRVLLPAYMRGRDHPYSLAYLMLLYNSVAVAFNAWATFGMVRLGFLGGYRWRCEPVDFSEHPRALQMAKVMYYAYLSKFVEFGDTVFFVLRKKDAQITALHLIHHSTVPLLSYIGVKYCPGGFNVFFPMLNTFVHTWMYLYYGLSAMGPKVQKYLWWKKYLTKLQLMQFSLVIVYYSQIILFPVEGCHVNRLALLNNLAPSIAFLVLFTYFYRATYRSKKKIA